MAEIKSLCVSVRGIYTRDHTASGRKVHGRRSCPAPVGPPASSSPAPHPVMAPSAWAPAGCLLWVAWGEPGADPGIHSPGVRSRDPQPPGVRSRDGGRATGPSPGAAMLAGPALGLQGRAPPPAVLLVRGHKGMVPHPEGGLSHSLHVPPSCRGAWHHGCRGVGEAMHVRATVRARSSQRGCQL